MLSLVRKPDQRCHLTYLPTRGQGSARSWTGKIRQSKKGSVKKNNKPHQSEEESLFDGGKLMLGTLQRWCLLGGTGEWPAKSTRKDGPP